MESERKNGRQLMDALARMRRHLDELEASMARQSLGKEIEQLVTELREVNERLVITSLDNLDRAKAAVAEAEAAQSRLEAVVALAPVAVLVAEAPSGGVVLQNDQVERTWRQTMALAGGVADYMKYAGFHPDGRPYLAEEWPLARSVQRGETVRDEEFTLARGDGSRGIVQACSAPLRTSRGRIVGGVMVLQDVTESRGAAQRLARLESALIALSEAATADEVADILLQQALEATGASAVCVALLAEDGVAVRLVRDVGHSEQVVAAFRHSPLGAPIPIVEVVRTGRPVLLRSAEERVARYPKLREVETGHRAFAGVPMVARRRTLGALGVCFLEERDLAEPERVFLENLARQGGLAFAAFGP